MRLKHSIGCSALALAFAAPIHAQQQTPDQQELRDIVQEQQQRIEQLELRLDTTASMVEQGGSAGWWKNTQVGGYGEMHYNGGDNPTIDFHRFVLFFNHQFNDDIRFFSEVEIEHAFMETTEVEPEDEDGDGQIDEVEVERTPGELELEQAYLEFDLTENHRAIAGVFLIPVGILNETHEPNTFYGVERNPVESHIIPTTWWEGGAGVRGQLMPGLGYDLAFHSGLFVEDDFDIRGGRQKVAEASAEAGAATGRLRWTAIPGVELAGTVQYQHNVRQSEGSEEVPAVLAEVHADVRRGPFGFRALYAQWNLDGDAAEAQGKDEQFGYYLEPSYRFTEQVGAFARYSVWDTAAGNDAETEMAQTDAGVNYWPHPRVVVKANYTWEDRPDSDDEEDYVNLGIGYQF